MNTVMSTWHGERTEGSVWENRWIRFRMALRQAGVDPRMHDYCRAWMLGFLGYLKPKRFSQVEAADVRGYLQRVADGGKQLWQIRQAQEAVRVFFTEVEPVLWARSWPEDLVPKTLKERLPEEGPAEVPRPPTARNGEGFFGRADTGDLPQRYVRFLEVVEETLRTERYAYRTEPSKRLRLTRFVL